MKQTLLLTAILILCPALGWTALPLGPANPVTPTTPAVAATPAKIQVRVKDISRVQGARDNQLMGYGLVVGLNGTGDSAQTQFTPQAISSMLQRMNITVSASKLKVKNVAAVIITANIGPFLTSGDRIDVTVSSLGDAASLQGGILLQTPLTAGNGQVYAVAQGAVSLGGYSASGGGASKTSGQPTVGRIPNGALVEQEVPTEIVDTRRNLLTFSLNRGDFTTAARMAEAINAKFGPVASARDAVNIDVAMARIPTQYQQKTVELIAAIGEVTLEPDATAKVVVNERTGTVVVGGQVRVTPVAVAQGGLTVTVNPALLVSQPPPLSHGSTVERPTADIEVIDVEVSLSQVAGPTVDELVRSLNAMKVSPRDIIAILQALKQAGALQAELEIM